MITLIALALLLMPFLLIGGGMAIFWRKKRRSVLRWSAISYAVSVVVMLLVVGPYLMAWAITHAGTRPPDRKLTETPADYGIAYEDVIFDARDSLRLSGWFIPPRNKNAILLCTHGLFRNRIEMLSRAVAAGNAGYGAFLYDSRSHGASDRGIASLGYYERNDVLGGIQYIQRRYQDSHTQPLVVLMGISMGASATLQAAAETRDYSALILDSPFSSLRETVTDHSWLLLRMPRYPFPSLFLFWFQKLAGFDAGQVNAREALQRVQPVPLLIVASEGDKRMRAEVARLLYNESRAPIKKLEVFGEDVPHGAAARLYPEAYDALLVGFLDRVLETRAVDNR